MNPSLTALATPLNHAQWSVAVNGVLCACGLTGVVFLGSGITSFNAPMKRLGIALLLLSGLMYFIWTELGPFRPVWLFLPLVLTGVLFRAWGRSSITAEMRRSADFAVRRRGLSPEEMKVAAIASDPRTLLSCWSDRAEREISANTKAANLIIESWKSMGRRAGQVTLAFLLAWGVSQFVSPYGGLPSFAFGEKKAETFQDFWPDDVLRSEEGYVTSAKFIPLRAIARRPNACLYTRADSENAADVVDIMKAWLPYFVFAHTEKSVLVAPNPNAKDDERWWALAKDCFCWTTRECLNIEKPTPIFRTLEDARTGKNPLDTKYTYPFNEHFTRAGKSEGRHGVMASLPIFANVEGKYFGFVRPEGTTGQFEICWLVWDGNDGAVECRLRASRKEFESYIIGIRNLMRDWQNAENKADAKKALYAGGQEHIMNVKRPPGMDVSWDTIKTRNEGIPRLDGYLQRPIESELAYEHINTKVIEMLKISNSAELWGSDDVTFVKLSDMP